MRVLGKTCLFGVVFLLLCGCGGKVEDAGFKVKGFFGMFTDPPPKVLAHYAFDAKVDPDLRRKAIISLSRHEWGLEETYLNGYEVVLQMEMQKPANRRDTALMSAAIGALGKGKNPKYIPTLVLALKLASSQQVRWDAAVALDSVVGEKAISQLCQSSDPGEEDSVDVRVACCRAMRHYRRQDVIDTLISRLSSEEEFSVRYCAHQTLVKLCGHDFGPDYTDWVATKLDKLPPVETKTEEKKSMWNPLNWFR